MTQLSNVDTRTKSPDTSKNETQSTSTSPQANGEDNTFIPPPPSRIATFQFFHNSSNYQLSGCTFTIVNGNVSVPSNSSFQNLNTNINSPEMPVPEPAAPPSPPVDHGFSENETRSTSEWTSPQTNDTALESDSSTVSPEEAHTDSRSSSSLEDEDEDTSMPPPPSSTAPFIHNAANFEIGGGRFTVVHGDLHVDFNEDGICPTVSFGNNRPFGLSGMGKSTTMAGNSTSSSPSEAHTSRAGNHGYNSLPPLTPRERQRSNQGLRQFWEQRLQSHNDNARSSDHPARETGGQ